MPLTIEYFDHAALLGRRVRARAGAVAVHVPRDAASGRPALALRITAEGYALATADGRDVVRRTFAAELEAHGPPRLPDAFEIRDGDLVLRLEAAEEGGWNVASPSHPGLLTQGDTVEECLLNAREVRRLLDRPAPGGR